MSDTGSSTPELFAVAISLDPAQRERYLDEVCNRDTAMRQELQRLIESHERAHDFLESPPIELSKSSVLLGDDEAVPAKIGNYRILKLLGAGGMGRVYLAESEKPRRRVALKVIKPGMASSAMLRRFEQEAQVVALLQHPGIAQIFEAGTALGSAGPQPYIAMEFVDGPVLTEYIRHKHPDVREKLLLVCKVCDAVTHAHQKGVIHRDLKPANILVDAAGQPKILDFGVARLTDPDTRTQTIHTHAGQLIGTLAYMSPEQVAGEPGNIDSRSDVYALGVILYEILTGKLPHDVNQRPIPEAIRIIREDTPTSLSTLDRGYRGDIETIVGKALEKDSDRRYQSAKELADDIRRSLRDEPIVARRPSTWYQFRKFGKRNKVLVGGVIATFAALAIGMLAAISQARAAEVARVDAVGKGNELAIALREMTRARAEADNARNDAVSKGEELKEALEQAQSHLEVARGLNTFLEGIVSAPDPDQHLGRDVTVLAALERSERDLQETMPTQPRVRGAIMRTIGQTYRSLAEYSKAEQYLRDAYELHREAFGRFHPETINSLSSLCMLLSEFGKPEQGLAIAEPEWNEFVLQADESDEIYAVFASAMSALFADVERLQDALRLARSAAAQREQTLGADHPTALNARYAVARLLSRLGEYDQAVDLKRQIVEAHRASKRPASIRSVIWYVGLGNDLQDLGRTEALGPLLDELVPMARQIFEPEHPAMLAVENLQGCYLIEEGRAAEAAAVLQSVAARHRLGQTPDIDGLVRVLSNLGAALREQGKLQDAEAAFREAYERATRPGVRPNRAQLAAINNYITVVRLEGRYADALPLAAQLVQKAEQVLEPGDWTIAAHRYGYGVCLLATRQPEAAQEQFLASEAVVSKLFSDDDERVVSVRRSLVNLYELWKKPEEAEKWRGKLPERFRHD
ncbi:MAG: tetratricopeptide repeat protein [Phycisphaerales bacterium]